MRWIFYNPSLSSWKNFVFCASRAFNVQVTTCIRNKTRYDLQQSFNFYVYASYLTVRFVYFIRIDDFIFWRIKRFTVFKRNSDQGMENLISKEVCYKNIFINIGTPHSDDDELCFGQRSVYDAVFPQRSEYPLGYGLQVGWRALERDEFANFVLAG